MSNERRKPFPFDRFEPKWQSIWDKAKTFHALNPGEAGFEDGAADVVEEDVDAVGARRADLRQRRCLGRAR